MLSFVSYIKRRISEAISPGCYISRRVLNAKQLNNWASLQNIGDVCSPDDLHVSVVYSRIDVRYHKDFILDKSTLTINPQAYYGRLQYLGDKGAVVLKFQDAYLFNRWRTFSSIGASWDYPTYIPHVTIAYHTSEVRWNAFVVAPPTFPLLLGPEIAEDLV